MFFGGSAREAALVGHRGPGPSELCHLHIPHHLSGPPHPSGLRASSVFPCHWSWSLVEEERGLKPRAAQHPRQGAGTSFPACPAVCGHRLALAPVTSDR
jgi:hypothetical protein